MVTFGEFVGYMVRSALIMGAAVAAVAVVRWKFGLGTRTLKRLAIGYGLMLLLIAGLILVSNVTETRCRSNPAVFCRYNDGVPSIATVVVVFTAVAVFRAWSLFTNRWQAGSPDPKNA